MAPYRNTRAAVADPETSNAVHRRPLRKRSANQRKFRHAPPKAKIYCECGCDSDSPLTDIDSDSEMEIDDVLGLVPMAGPPVASNRNTISQRENITNLRQVSPHGANQTQIRAGVFPVTEEELAKFTPAQLEEWERALAEGQTGEFIETPLNTPRATPDPDDPEVPTIDVDPFVHRKPNAQGVFVGRFCTKVVDWVAWETQQRRKAQTLGRQGTEILEDP